MKPHVERLAVKDGITADQFYAIAAAETAFAAAEGKHVRFRDLAKKHVKLDESTRCKPDDGNKEIYARLLAKQSDLTKRLHAAGYL